MLYFKSFVPFVLFALSNVAFAQQTIVLKVADAFPVGHYIPTNTIIPWMKKVEELTKGKVKFEYYPAEQLGKAKDMLSKTQAGVIDVGYVVPSYVSDKLPLSAVTELPGSFDSSCSGTLAAWQLGKPGGELDKAEYQSQGVRMLLAHLPPPYMVLTANKPITSVESLKHLKIRTTGGAMNLAAQKIGAVPVQMSWFEVRESLARGTLDGLMTANVGLPPADLDTQVKYAVTGINFGSALNSYMIRSSKWTSLPADVQEAMLQASELAVRTGCQAADNIETEVITRLSKGQVSYVRFSDADRAKVNRSLGEVSKEWATAMDARKLPGTKLLGAFQQALAAPRKN